MVLPAPFGPISPRISPDLTSKLTLLTATRPPNRRCASLDFEKQRAGRRLLAARQRASPLADGTACSSGRKPARNGTMPCAGALQEQDEQRRERHDLELAGGALGDQRQIVLHGILQERDDGRTHHAAQNAAGAADHRHHQIFDAHAGIERPGADEAAEMGIEPAGQRAEERGDDERHQLDLECADAEAFDQRIAAAQRAHRAADAGVEQIVADAAGPPRRSPRSGNRSAGSRPARPGRSRSAECPRCR